MKWIPGIMAFLVICSGVAASCWWTNTAVEKVKEELLSIRSDLRERSHEELRRVSEQLNETRAKLEFSERRRTSGEKKAREVGSSLLRANEKIAKLRSALDAKIEQEKRRERTLSTQECFQNSDCGDREICWARRCVPKRKPKDICGATDDCVVGACLGGRDRKECSTGELGETCESDRDCIRGSCTVARSSALSAMGIGSLARTLSNGGLARCK